MNSVHNSQTTNKKEQRKYLQTNHKIKLIKAHVMNLFKNS
jgi:mannose-6-phosphate isomerase class I